MPAVAEARRRPPPISLVTDIAAPAGRSGVYASTNAGGLEARFDNYRLYAPSPERPRIYRLYGG